MATSTTPRTPGTVSPGNRPSSRGAPPDRDLRTPRAVPAGTGAPPRTRPVDAPRHTRPLAGRGTRAGAGPEPAVRPGTRPARPLTAKPATRPLVARPATRPLAAKPSGTRPEAARPRLRHPRAPFILLLVGLLGGALVCLLVISTTLAQGSYQVTSLQQQNASLAKQQQLLTQQIAQASSPAQIAQEAEALGMKVNPNLQFVDPTSGKVVKGHPSAAQAQLDVPGYTP
jgi:hypothetical protein